jgi:DNA-binding response OmpR family regulator
MTQCPCCGQPIPENSGLIVSLEMNTVMVRGNVAHLGSREAEIVFVLAQAMPVPVSRQSILKKVWAVTEREPSINNIDVYISNIRRKILPLGLKIMSHHGKGFQLVDFIANIKQVVA